MTHLSIWRRIAVVRPTARSAAAAPAGKARELAGVRLFDSD
jgi:hypothetical protein